MKDTFDNRDDKRHDILYKELQIACKKSRDDMLRAAIHLVDARRPAEIDVMKAWCRGVGVFAKFHTGHEGVCQMCKKQTKVEFKEEEMTEYDINRCHSCKFTDLLDLPVEYLDNYYKIMESQYDREST